jgi:hypothetical protein
MKIRIRLQDTIGRRFAFTTAIAVTPAQRKPMPVTTPWATLVGVPRTCAAEPPYHNGAKPTKTVNAVDAMHTRPTCACPPPGLGTSA